MLGTAQKTIVLTAALLVTSPVAFGQGYPVEVLAAPALIDESTPASVFHSVSAPEVLAKPAALQSPFSGPTPAGPPNTYAGVGPAPLPPLAIRSENLKCCPGEKPGQECQVDRYLEKPTHLPKEELECVICLKEPYTESVPVKEQVEVVVYRCFKTTAPFEYSGCEDGTCFHKKGEKELKRMRPCTVTVDLNYEKKVVKYRDVWYHVRCEK